MHPVEATLYYSAGIMPALLGLHPALALGCIADCAFGAWLGHDGFQVRKKNFRENVQNADFPPFFSGLEVVIISIICIIVILIAITEQVMYPWIIGLALMPRKKGTSPKFGAAQKPAKRPTKLRFTILQRKRNKLLRIQCNVDFFFYRTEKVD